MTRSSPRRLAVALALLLAAPVALHAQAADSATFTRPGAADARAARAKELESRRRRLDYVPAARFAEARRRAERAGSQGAPVHVAADQETSYTLVVRTDSSQVEQHARWDDIIIVQSGRGGVLFGKKSTGRRMLAPGEYRGGRLEEPWRLRLAPGDVVRVPAGVPHAFWREGDQPLEYLVIKVRRPDRPLAPE